jgi:transposase InsO family protein
LANLLTNHLAQTAAIDFFTVPTATFRVLFVFVVLVHERRRVLHFGVTEHPTREWTMQQMREVFPWDQAPRFVLRDRDAIYGTDFANMTRDMGMDEVLTAPRVPWQNPLVERLVGSIRRECLHLWLANCYFAHDSLGFPALLPFCDSPSGHSFHSSVPWPACSDQAASVP